MLTYCSPPGYGAAIFTLWGRENGHHFPDDIFRYICSNENVWISIKISLKFIPINSVLVLVQIMTWHRTGDNPLLEPITASFAEGYVRYSASMSLMCITLDMYSSSHISSYFSFTHNTSTQPYRPDPIIISIYVAATWFPSSYAGEKVDCSRNSNMIIICCQWRPYIMNIKFNVDINNTTVGC